MVVVHVLVIEPSSTLRNVLEISLRREGCTVISFANPVEALRFLYAFPACIPCVALVSTRLPTMNCCDLIQHFRSTPAFRHIVIIIILNARDTVLDRLFVRLAGAKICLARPLKIQTVLTAVFSFLPLTLVR